MIAQPMMNPGMNMGLMGYGNPYQQFGYGSAGMPPSMGYSMAPAKGPSMHGPGARRKLNGLSIALSFLIPLAIFFTPFYLMSFNMHYLHPNIVYLLCAAVLAIALGFGAAAAHAVQKRKQGFNVEPSWFLFLFATSLLAWGAGFMLGEYNYAVNTLPYFDRTNLRTIMGVDPGDQAGTQLMDAGQIIFKQGTHVDTKLSYSYKNTHTYCAAPVVSADGAKLANYDFWAVGVDCCFTQGDFSCGDMYDPKYHAGLRWWGDEAQQNFFMAVGQAEAAYGIKANHPIFIEWVQDPVQEVGKHLRTAFTFLGGCVAAFVVIQAVLTGTATYYYSGLHAVHHQQAVFRVV